MWALILTISVAFGHGEVDAIRAIERANQGVQNMYGSQQGCAGYCGYSYYTEPQPWQKCIKEICGDSLGAYSRDVFEAMKDPQGFIKKYPWFPKALQVAYGQDMIEKAKTLALMDSAIRSGRKIEDKMALHLLDYMQMSREVSKLSFKVDSGKVAVDREASRLALPQLQQEEFDRLVAHASRIATDLQSQPEVFAYDQDDISFRLPREKVAKEVQMVIKEIGKMRAASLKATKLPAELYAEEDRKFQQLAARLKAGDFSADNLAALRERYQSTEGLYFVVKSFDPKVGARLKPQSVRDLLSDDAKKTIAGRMQELNDGFAMKPSPVNDTFVGIYNTCMATAMQAMKWLPTPQQKQKFLREEEPALRRQYLDKLGGMLSEETRGKANDLFGRLKARGPADSAEYMDDFKRRLTAASQKVKIKSWLDTPKATQEMVIAVGTITAGETDNWGSELKTICQEKTIRESEAHALGDTDGMYLGQSVARGAPTAQYVAFHEYSHVLSIRLFALNKSSAHSRKWYDSVRQCIDEGQGPKKFVEEDWGDVLAFSLTGQGTKFNCYGLTGVINEEFDLGNPDPHDPHNGTLFRLLHAQAAEGKPLPDECKQALGERDQHFKLPNCLDKKNWRSEAAAGTK